jgi:hypothetical protein
VPESAYNATFGAVLIGSSSGECNVGYTGTISATCLLDYSSGSTAYYGAPTGSCNRTSGEPRHGPHDCLYKGVTNRST